MPVRACPERRKDITATDEQNGMKGQTREKKNDKGEKNARRRTRATEVKHNTKKKDKKNTHKQKLNIHTWLVGSKYVACYVTLRNKHETRTATTPTKVKGDHEA